MSDVTIHYKGSAIAAMDASGTKTLLTEGKYCEDDIEVTYVKPSGGSTTFPYVSIRGMYNVSNLYNPPVKPVGAGPKVTMDLPYCLDIRESFGQYTATNAYKSDIEEVELTLYNNVDGHSAFRRNTSIKKVTFPRGITLRAGPKEFLANSQIETIVGAIGFSSTVQANNFTGIFNSDYIKDIELVPNQIPYGFSCPSTVLTDTSLISFANGLSESATSQTATFASAVVTRMASIMGTVAMDPSNTYHVFTADAGGTVSLSDFVTTTKGWTLST